MEAKSSNPAEIFDVPKLAIDRLPQLRALFERVSAGFVDKFKEFTNAPIACFLNQVQSGNSWDHLDGREECLAALYYVQEWDTQILLAIERRLLYAAMDAMFGGDGTEAPAESSNPLTSLEIQIAKEMFECSSTCLASAFAPLTPVSLSFERIETETEFTILGSENIPSIFAQLLLQFFDSGGRVFILVPSAPLLPLRKKLGRSTLRENQSEDPRWTKQLQSRISTTEVPVVASADGPIMMLGEIVNLQVGQIIPIEVNTNSEVILASGTTAMFKCGLGQCNGRLSIRVEGAADAPKGLTERVLTEAVKGWSSAGA